MKLRQATLLALISSLAAAPAFAQYRQGTPPVLSAPPRADPDAPANKTLADFSRWNVAAGKPHILVFWNRELTDETATREEKRFSETETNRNGKTVTQDSTNTQFGTASNTNEDTISERKYDSVESSKVTTGGKYAAVDKLASRVLEDTYTNVFLAAGAQIIDRDALIRRISAGMSKADRLDLQFLESKALDEHVDYLIEVLPDTGKGGEALYSVSVRHLPSSRVIAKFISSGEVPRGAPHYVATSHGFELTSENRTTPERTAGQIAVETMSRMAGSR